MESQGVDERQGSLGKNSWVVETKFCGLSFLFLSIHYKIKNPRKQEEVIRLIISTSLVYPRGRSRKSK